MYHDAVAFTFDRFENHLRAFYVNQPLIYHGTFNYQGDAMLNANGGEKHVSHHLLPKIPLFLFAFQWVTIMGFCPYIHSYVCSKTCPRTSYLFHFRLHSLHVVYCIGVLMKLFRVHIMLLLNRKWFHGIRYRAKLVNFKQLWKWFIILFTFIYNLEIIYLFWQDKCCCYACLHLFSWLWKA